MKILFTLSFFLLLNLYANGQQLFPVVITPGGGIAQSSRLTLEWTVGDVAVETIRFPVGLLTEGFHQPILNIHSLSITPETQNLNDKYRIRIYPNPADTWLKVRIESLTDEPVYLYLFDQYGQMVQIYKNIQPFHDQHIDLNDRPAGMYLLMVQTDEGNLIGRFRVVKIN